MSGRKIWSDQKKKYISSLLPAKKILFANVDGKPKAYWDITTETYDIIIGYCYNNDYYVAIKYDLHRENKTVYLECISEFITKKHKICVGKRKRSSERIIYIPSKELEEFCSYYSYYMDKYQN